jgi:hypothetical protein
MGKYGAMEIEYVVKPAQRDCKECMGRVVVKR